MHPGICRIDYLWVCGDCLGVRDICIAAGMKSGKGRCADGLHVNSGTLPGLLLLLQRKCICVVNLRVCLAVGLGAAIMGGASVIRCRGGASAW
jgi:hypothetical protein